MKVIQVFNCFSALLPPFRFFSSVPAQSIDLLFYLPILYYLMQFSTMHTGTHIAPFQVTVPSLLQGAVEHAVSRLHILILLINLSFAFTLIILS